MSDGIRGSHNWANDGCGLCVCVRIAKDYEKLLALFAEFSETKNVIISHEENKQCALRGQATVVPTTISPHLKQITNRKKKQLKNGIELMRW